MSAHSALLAQPEHARIFAQRVILQSEFNQTTPQEIPKAILTAGQPGAGKGGLVKAAEAELERTL